MFERLLPAGQDLLFEWPRRIRLYGAEDTALVLDQGFLTSSLCVAEKINDC